MKNLLSLIFVFFNLTALVAQPSNNPVKRLDSLIKEIVMPIKGVPTEHGSNWKKWTRTGNNWNTLVATSTGLEKSKADLIFASLDSIPLIALVATDRQQYYQYLQIHGNLTRGWQIKAHAATKTGKVECVVFSRDKQQIYILNKSDSHIPAYLVMPLSNKNYLVLFWDKYGEVFEHVMIYNPAQQSVLTFGQYALTPISMENLYIKLENEDWLELTFRKTQVNPVAIALHHQFPGNLQALLLDFEKDGQMDILGETPISDNRFKLGKISKSNNGKNFQGILELRKIIVGNTNQASALWYELQGLWAQLNPLNVQLPEVIRF